MKHFDIAARLTKLRNRMKAEGVDAFAVVESINVEYLTGFDYIRDTSNPHAVLITADEARFLTDARYLEVAQTQAAESSLWQIDDPGKKLVFKDMHELWNLATYGTIALEDSLPYRLFEAIKKSAQPAKVVPVKNWVEDIRTVKDAAELARIEAAQNITDQAFTQICGFIKPGLSEKEIALELEYIIRKLGADAISFPPIVAAGPNGSLPHAVPSDRIVQAGDLLTLDFGAGYGGYCSDMTRTVFVSSKDEVDSENASSSQRQQPSDEQRRIYETVLAAQEASLAAFKAGVRGIEVDAAGRKVIEEAGYGDYFVHGTGHGVGLYIHELPNATPRSEEKLPAGSVLTCEPGIYIPGKLGVRIEDMVIVTEEGSRNITTSPKELLII